MQSNCSIHLHDCQKVVEVLLGLLEVLVEEQMQVLWAGEHCESLELKNIKHYQNAGSY